MTVILNVHARSKYCTVTILHIELTKKIADAIMLRKSRGVHVICDLSDGASSVSVRFLSEPLQNSGAQFNWGKNPGENPGENPDENPGENPVKKLQ